jgi:hypothetical protein
MQQMEDECNNYFGLEGGIRPVQSSRDSILKHPSRTHKIIGLKDFLVRATAPELSIWRSYLCVFRSGLCAFWSGLRAFRSRLDQFSANLSG